MLAHARPGDFAHALAERMIAAETDTRSVFPDKPLLLLRGLCAYRIISLEVRVDVLELVDPLQRLSTFATETVAAALRNELGAFVASVGFHVRSESGERVER